MARGGLAGGSSSGGEIDLHGETYTVSRTWRPPNETTRENLP